MFASDKILALDIGAATVKVAEFQPSKTHGLRLTNFNFADLGVDPEHEENRKALIVSAVRNALREKGIHTTTVIFSVSGQSVFTRFVKLPPVDEDKVVQIIQYEAQQNVPFPIEEVIWDYQLIGSTQEGELEVVLLAIKSDIIEDLNEAVESAGLNTQMVDVAPMALCNAVRYNRGDLEGCTIILDMGARTTNLLFLEGNRVFSRSIPIAGNAITQSIASELNISFAEAEQLKRAKGFVALGGAYEEPADEQQARISKIIRNVMTRLHAEVARSVNFYKGQQAGSPPRRLLLSGGSSIIPYADRFFQEKLQIPIEYFNPFHNIEIAPNVPKDELSRCAHFFGEVVGLGLRRVTECPLEVNLLPRSIRARKQMKQRQPYFFSAAACLLLIPLCWLAYTQKTASLKQRERADVQQELQRLQQLDQSLQNQKRQLDDVKGKADQIAEIVKQRSLWPEFLDDFNQRVPQGIWITALRPLTAAEVTAAAAAAAGGEVGGSPGGRFSRPTGGEEPPPSTESQTQTAAAGPVSITDIDITGAGLHTMQDLTLVDGFASNLKQSSFFGTNATDVVIARPPSAMPKEQEFTFLIRAKLAKPIIY